MATMRRKMGPFGQVIGRVYGLPKRASSWQRQKKGAVPKTTPKGRQLLSCSEFESVGGFSQLKAIWRWRQKIARRGILAALLITTLLAGGCAYNGYYTDYPYYGDYYYPYSYPYYEGYYPYYGFSGGFSNRHGGHHGKHFGHGAAAIVGAAATERAGTPQTVRTLSRAGSRSKAGEIFFLPADKMTRHSAPFKPCSPGAVVTGVSRVR
jgi:hypothetical protein